MNHEGLKNIVLLKDLPSNIIEEAIIVLKENKKIHKYQKIIDKQNKEIKAEEKAKNEKLDTNKNKQNYNINQNSYQYKSAGNNLKNKKINENDYIIKEAYMLIEDYTKKLETETPKWKNNLIKLEKRYKVSIKINIILLSIILLGTILISFKLI